MIHLMKLLKCRSGSVVTAFAIALIPTITAAGVAVDYSRMSEAKASLQRAIDAAVLAGLRQPVNSRIDYATQMFRSQLQGHLTPNISNLQFFNEADGVFRGEARITLPMTMMKIAGIRTKTVSADARGANTANGAAAGAGKGVCLLVLDPTADQSLLLNSGARVNARNCEIHVRSNANPDTIHNAGVDLDIKKLCAKGRILFNAAMTSPYEERCAAATDPFAGTLPEQNSSGCLHSGGARDATGAERSYAPGIWCGTSNFNGAQTIRFQPGVHIIKGRININSGSTIIAENVTFYLTRDNSDLRMNGSVKLTLTAPTSGPTAGIAMYESPGLDQSQFVFNGFNGQLLQGLIYLPSRNVTFNSTSSATADKATIVVNQAILNSTSWNIDVADDVTKRIDIPGSATAMRPKLMR